MTNVTPTSLKDLAKDIQAQTGMKYTEALSEAKQNIHCPNLEGLPNAPQYADMLSKLHYVNDNGKLSPWVEVYDPYNGYQITVKKETPNGQFYHRMFVVPYLGDVSKEDLRLIESYHNMPNLAQVDAFIVCFNYGSKTGRTAYTIDVSDLSAEETISVFTETMNSKYKNYIADAVVNFTEFA